MDFPLSHAYTSPLNGQRLGKEIKCFIKRIYNWKKTETFLLTQKDAHSSLEHHGVGHTTAVSFKAA